MPVRPLDAPRKGKLILSSEIHYLIPANVMLLFIPSPTEELWVNTAQIGTHLEAGGGDLCRQRDPSRFSGLVEGKWTSKAIASGCNIPG